MLMIFIDAGTVQFTVEEKWTDLLQLVLITVIGAYFLDSGLHAVKNFIIQHLRIEIDQVLDNTHQQDFKTLLQELAQKRYRTHPIYRLVKQEGPDHNQTFWMQVSLNGKIYGPGKGKNKKNAEQVAAGYAYRALNF